LQIAFFAKALKPKQESYFRVESGFTPAQQASSIHQIEQEHPSSFEGLPWLPLI